MPAQVYKDMLEVMIRRGGPYSGADVPEFYSLMDRCFGCAVCASGCPSEAIEMEAKPGRSEPPKTVKDLGAAVKGAR